MEEPGYVKTKYRKGWVVLTTILSCFLIAYWSIQNNNLHMSTGTTASVKGVLYESATGAPVAGAIVMITEGSYEHPDIAAQTDDQGNFSLPALRIPGSYTLLINYSNQSKTVNVNIANDSVLRIPL